MQTRPFLFGGTMKKDDRVLELITKAKERYEECLTHQNEFRECAKEELRFGRLGEQWSKEDKESRKGRPCLTINKTNTFINYAVNEIKQNKPKIKVRPFDDKADIDTADVINGIISHISADSNLDGAVDCASGYAVSCGMGFFRVITEYEEGSFDQKISIDRISNSFRVVLPFHLCEKEDFSDAPYGFIITRMSKDDYKKKYNDDTINWDIKEVDDCWQTEKDVIIAEYFTSEAITKTLVQLSDGAIGYKEDLAELPEGIAIVRERKCEERQVKWYKLNSVDILEETVWPGKYIPIVAIMGQEVDVDGKKDYISLTRYSKDPQKSFNYLKSKEAEVIGLAPISPWTISEGQLGDGGKYLNMWSRSNSAAYAALVYKTESVNGTIVPPPRRADNLQIPTAFVQAAQEANSDMKETIGLWSANLGAQGNETSGVAIKARSMQGSMTNSHFMDNTIKALKYCGRILVDLIPKIYTGERAVRILGEDKKEEVVKINAETIRNGKPVLYDVSVGTYDVVVDIGANFATRRMELEAQLGELMQKLPPQMSASISDLFVRSMDVEYANEMADRLKKLIDPKVFEKEGEISPALVQQLKAALDEFGKKEQDLLKVIGKQQEELDDKDKELKSKYDIAMLNASKDLEIASMKSSIEELKVHHEQTQAFMERMIPTQNEPAPTQNVEEQPPSGE